MTRKSVYGGALLAFLAASVMTVLSITEPRWISWDVSSESGSPVHYAYGLHERCSSLTQKCEYWPAEEHCIGADERYMCTLWRSVGFLMSFAVVIEGMSLMAFVIMLFGGKQKRVAGWKVLGTLLFLIGALQAAGMSIIAYVYDNDDRFFPGWRLDASFGMCTASWCIMMLTASGLIASAFLLPEEAGYELIPSGEAAAED